MMETGLPRTGMDEDVMSLHACAREGDTVNVACSDALVRDPPQM